MRNYLPILSVLASALAASSPARAATDVTFAATLTNSCVLTLSQAGTMTVSSTGTVLGSEQSGGTAATLGVVAIGSLPTLAFAAPALTASPSGWSASHTDEIRYTSTRGASQTYTASSSSHPLTGLNDTFTIYGRVTSSEGFAAGNYTLRSVATCS